MPDVETQLRDYFVEVVDHIDVDDLVAGAHVNRRAFAPRRRWVAAIVAAFVVLVVVGAVPLLIRLVSAPEGPVVTQPPPADDFEPAPVDVRAPPPFQATVSLVAGSGTMLFGIEYGGLGGGFRWENLD